MAVSEQSRTAALSRQRRICKRLYGNIREAGSSGGRAKTHPPPGKEVARGQLSPLAAMPGVVSALSWARTALSAPQSPDSVLKAEHNAGQVTHSSRTRGRESGGFGMLKLTAGSPSSFKPAACLPAAERPVDLRHAVACSDVSEANTSRKEKGRQVGGKREAAEGREDRGWKRGEGGRRTALDPVLGP